MLRIFITIVFVALTAVACGGDPNSFESISRLAEEGDSVAQYKLGEMLVSGEGAEKDVSKGEAWLIKSAQQGETDAINELASLYINEFSREPSANKYSTNKKMAFDILESAAVRGDAESQRLLAIMYGAGIGGAKNEAKSLEWIQRSATNGDAEAQLIMSRFYSLNANGRQGVPRSKKLEIEWALKAAEQNNPYAQRRLGTLYTEANVLPEERALQDIEKGKEWYKKGFETFKGLAEAGDIEAQYELGSIYFEAMGVGVIRSEEEFDRKKSFFWFLKAAEQGHAYAQLAVAEAYANGRVDEEKGYGVKKDKAKAIEWYRKAAGQGVEDASYILKNEYATEE